MLFINQLRSLISTGYSSGPTETTTGGRALKFYSSVRIEVRRASPLTRNDVPVGHELKIKVTKNKQAPPFRTANTTLIYGKGVPVSMAVLDMALEMNVVKRKGSWIAYRGEILAQGKDATAEHLQKYPDLMEEIKKEVLAKVAEANGLVTGKSDEADGSADMENPLDESILDEDAITMNIDLPTN